MKWYIHIGPNKTATTSAQSAFDHSRRELKKQGILYPKAGAVSCAHHVLNFSLSLELNGKAPLAQVFGIKEIPTLEEIIKSIREEAKASNCDMVLLSSETLWDWPLKRIERLREVLGADEASIILSLRPSIERELSMWQEHVKHGYLGTSTEYITQFSDTALSKNKTPYFDKCIRWKKHDFGILPIPFPSIKSDVNLWDMIINECIDTNSVIGTYNNNSSLNEALDYYSIMVMQKSFRKAIDNESLDASHGEKFNKTQPVKTAVDIREVVISMSQQFHAHKYPAYMDIIMDDKCKSITDDASLNFHNDVEKLLTISTNCRNIEDLIPSNRNFKDKVDDSTKTKFKNDLDHILISSNNDSADIIKKYIHKHYI